MISLRTLSNSHRNLPPVAAPVGLYTKANLNATENQVFSEHLNLECNNQTLAMAAFRAMRKAQKENGDH